MYPTPESNQGSEPIKASTPPAGWQALLEGFPWFVGEGHYPLPAYSEFMPPPRLGRTAYGEIDTFLYNPDDIFGWPISELEQEYELKPGIEKIAHQVMGHLVNLGTGLIEHHISGDKGKNLIDNPYWPPELAERAGNLPHERYVALLPLVLSRTQDDKGRIRWTLFGSSELGPDQAFWKGFYKSPGQELPAEEFLAFIRELLSMAYGEKVGDFQQLDKIGFRILPGDHHTDYPSDRAGTLPSWSKPLTINAHGNFESVRYLLTFLPFKDLPDMVKECYLKGSLALLPFPGSLVFWGMPPYQKLRKELPTALQIPLLHLVGRNGGPAGIRVPQSSRINEPLAGGKLSEIHEKLVIDSYPRTNRWDRSHRYEDESIINPRLMKVAKTLFSNDLESLGLYDKPMAKNCHLWKEPEKEDFTLLLNGPIAHPKQIHEAEVILAEGGLFGYRFFFPPMQVGHYEIYWHTLLAAFYSSESNQAVLIYSAPKGFMTASDQEKKHKVPAIELWPRLLRRPDYLSAIQHFDTQHDYYPHQTALNIITLLESHRLLGGRPLQRAFARDLLRLNKHETLDGWLSNLPEHTSQPEIGREMQHSLEKILEAAEKPLPSEITYNQTANRVFETAYWYDIFNLAHGNFRNKDNADCILDSPNEPSHDHRDLEELGDYLIARHQDAIAKAGMQGKAMCGEMPFHWQTDFDFPLFGGWKRNQDRVANERNILVIIPGRDRSQAVVLADHYDTAYMEDRYKGGIGAREAAEGADDNYSATATLLQAAPIYLKLASEGRLERDIWLLHLTGEEFPSDCLGARHFSQALVEKTLNIRLAGGQIIDMSQVRVVGVYVMDMIAHNKDHDQDTFQMSPGRGVQSLILAWHAHIANRIWNARTREWNNQPDRRGRGRGKRSQDGVRIPEIADTLPLDGEVRTETDPQSSLFNTDGQIFSDTGIPVVLFMENYDITRTGYHDTKDTMENIDLDYGAALAAIAIETAARVATQPGEISIDW